MGQVFSGFVCGYILALFTTPILAVVMLRLRSDSASLQQLLPRRLSVLPITVVLHGGLFLFWTAVGMILGLLLLAMPEDRAALGSAHLGFTVLITSSLLMLTPPLLFLSGRFRGYVLVTLLVALLVFGWLMPHMVSWAKFESSPKPAPPVYHRWSNV